MKHPSNRELFDYWNMRRGERLAPERGDIEPAAIRKILGDTFVLEREGGTNPVFRLAGTRLCALFARELKGESFGKLWERTGQNAMRDFLRTVRVDWVDEAELRALRGAAASLTNVNTPEDLAGVGGRFEEP